MADHEDLPDIHDLSIIDCRSEADKISGPGYISDNEGISAPEDALDDDEMVDIDKYLEDNKASNDYARLPPDQAYAPWMTPAMCRAPTTIIPFDGKGRDPSTLVGLKVRRHRLYMGTGCLELRCTSERVQFFGYGNHKIQRTHDDDDDAQQSQEPQKIKKVHSIFGYSVEEDEDEDPDEGRGDEEDEDDDNGDYDGISIDSNLSRALDLIGRCPHHGPLVIEEAVVGIRESRVTDLGSTKFLLQKHQVIGLRLDGMAEMGFIAYKTEKDEDYDPDDADGGDDDDDDDDDDDMEGDRGYMVKYEDVVVGH
ncbi:MAG: hypothetical protein Q9187_004645 [Circinaria calcarea]